MIFNSISLENFGIIKKFSKQFDKSILVLAGENGEGKSTILKAILLAVFDDYENTLSEYVNWESDYFQVTVNFTHRGIDYEVIVRYDGSTDRTLRFKDKVLKGDEAKKKLKETIDFDLLKAGMLAMEQKVAIVDTKPAERREYLKRIYDIEFKRQLADLEGDIKASELELAKKTTLQTEVENRKYTTPSKLEYPFGEIEYNLIKANLEIERSKLHAAEENCRLRTQTEMELDALNNQKDKLNESIELLDFKISENQEKKQGLPEAKNIIVISETSNKDAWQEGLKQAEGSFALTYESTNAMLASIILERPPAFNLDDFNSVSQELYSKKAKLSELESATDICPTCGQSISSPEHIEKRKDEVKVLNQSIAELSKRFKELSDQKKRRELVEKNNLEKTNNKTKLQHEIDMLTEKLNTDKIRFQSKIDQIQAKLDRLDAEYLAEDVKLGELILADTDNKKNLKSQLNSIIQKVADLRDKLKGIAIVSTDGIKKVIQKFELDIQSYDEVTSRNIEIERMEKQIAIQKENDTNQLEALKTEIQVLNQLIGDWKLGIKILRTEFPVYVISRVIKDIEKAMNEFLKRTYPKYAVEVQDKKNALQIVYGPKKKDVGSASGFERQIFSLSFMYAISRAIGNKCLLLDECDSQASDTNSGIFYRVIGDAIGKGFDQIILISHKSSTRNILEFDYGAEVLVFDKGDAS
jgi:DNA repair exonuclease SbcCD ATPase subunit